jgi:hypothetical protein
MMTTSALPPIADIEPHRIASSKFLIPERLVGNSTCRAFIRHRGRHDRLASERSRLILQILFDGGMEQGNSLRKTLRKRGTTDNAEPPP